MFFKTPGTHDMIDLSNMTPNYGYFIYRNRFNSHIIPLMNSFTGIRTYSLWPMVGAFPFYPHSVLYSIAKKIAMNVSPSPETPRILLSLSDCLSGISLIQSITDCLNLPAALPLLSVCATL